MNMPQLSSCCHYKKNLNLKIQSMFFEKKHKLELGNTLHEAKKNQGQIDRSFLKVRCMFMMDLQSSGPEFNFPPDRQMDSRCRQSLVQILDHACTNSQTGLPSASLVQLGFLTLLCLVELLYILLTIYFPIGQEPTVTFGNQRNLQISQLSASGKLTNQQIARAMHDFQWLIELSMIASLRGRK